MQAEEACAGKDELRPQAHGDDKFVRLISRFSRERLSGPSLLCLLLFLACLAGCSKSPPPQEVPISPLVQLGNLPGLRESADAVLQEELARIEEEGGTPKQLTARLPPAEENLATVLVDIFPKERLDYLLAQTADWLTRDPSKIDDSTRQSIKQLLDSYRTQRAAVRVGLTRPKCQFPIQFTAGFGADLSFLEQMVTATRLEGLAVLVAVDRGDVDAALDGLTVMLRLCGRVAWTKHPQVRIQAALGRARTLQLCQSVVKHLPLTREHLTQLAGVLRREVAAWPPDRDAWIGARALGLHTYEVVRIGRLYDVLTSAEVKELREGFSLEELVRTVRENADRDERYYLLQMRELIALCDKPYFERKTELERRKAEWQHKARDSTVLVACRLLLPPVPDGQRIQAEDLANVLAFLTAIELASGVKQAAQVTNPLTGEPYWVEEQNEWLYLSRIGTAIGEHGAIEVPIKRGAAQDKRGPTQGKNEK